MSIYENQIYISHIISICRLSQKVKGSTPACPIKTPLAQKNINKSSSMNPHVLVEMTECLSVNQYLQ